MGPTGLESNALNPEQISGRIFPTQRKTLPLSKPGKAKLAGIVRTLPIKTVNSNQTGPKPAPHVHTSISSRLKVDFAPVVNSAYLAGPLGHFLPNWRRITNDPTILEMIQGYKLTVVYLNSGQKHSQTTPTIFLSRNGKDRPRNLRALGKRSAACVQTGFRSVYKQFVFGTEKGRKISPCDQSKGPEHISSVRSFQNGG